MDPKAPKSRKCVCLQGILLSQGWNQALPHYRQILYNLSYQGRPKKGTGTLNLRTTYYKLTDQERRDEMEVIDLIIFIGCLLLIV